MDYPTRTVFYSMTETENDYNEVVKTRVVSFTTGTRPATVSFKDKLQSDVSVSGEQHYLFTRKNPNTLGVKVNDELTMPGVSIKFYRVLAIDPKLTNRKELMFLVDALE